MYDRIGSEVALLRRAWQEFSRSAPSSPDVDRLPADSRGDPDVERLFEGFAFLAAQVRERIEDELPEVIHDLAEILVPSLLRHVPACSVVEFTPRADMVRKRIRVARDETELAALEDRSATPGGRGEIRFRTTADLDLLPVAIHQTALDLSRGGAPVLRIQARAPQAALPAVFEKDGLRIFIHGEYPTAASLALLVARHLAAVEVRGLGKGGRVVSLDPRSVRLVGFDPDFPLLPWPRLAPQGYRTIQEYFTLREKLLFFDIRDLHLAREVAEERFEVVLRFSEGAPALVGRMESVALRTNCSPVVNLSRAPADPVQIDVLGQRALLRTSPSGGAEIYSVESVSRIPTRPGERRVRLDPFSAFRSGQAPGAIQYRLRRVAARGGGGIDTFLSVVSAADAGHPPGPMTLSVDTTVTNPRPAASLRVGSIDVATESSPTQATFTNILPVSLAVPPPLGTGLPWRLVSHLGLARGSLGSAAALRDLLHLYNFRASTGDPTGEQNRRRIDAILEVRTTGERRLVGGDPVRGVHCEIGLDDAPFQGAGDAFLFCSAIDELLAARAGVNSFVRLSVLFKSGRRYDWAPRAGARVLV